jgi:phosphopantothenoylcysteine decarboxylase/phosphopantothenate--cysteine ligase
MKPAVILGVTGSVAAYRACDVARDLMRNGVEVRACLSRSAAQFVTPALFEGLTGQPVLTDVFDEPVRGRMAHIDWAREANALLVCPATANAIAVLARGESDDMFTTIAQATRAQLVVAPAMNPEMYASAATQDNLAVLRERGAIVVEPGEGMVACGEQGQGKLAATDEIVAATLSAIFRSRLLEGVRIVITAGPTQEPIDPVRYISNRSSGRMGYELARAAMQMGASVTLISGPTSLAAPPGAELVRVATALQMREATIATCDGAQVLIGAAAVADYRAESPSAGKIKRDGPMQLELVENPDILMEAGQKYPGLKIVGFAAETSDHHKNATKKLQEKGLFAIAVNDVSRSDIGFDSAENELTLLLADGSRVEIARASKFNAAVALLEALAAELEKSQ